MSLQQYPEDWKTFLHAPLAHENETVCNKVIPLCSLPNRLDRIQQDEPSKHMDNVSNTQRQTLDPLLPLSNLQKSMSPTNFLSHSHGNSMIEPLHPSETYNAHNSCSPTKARMPSLGGYWQTDTIQTDARPESHVSQQHPCLMVQQQLPHEPVNNNRLERPYYSPQITTQLSPVCSYFPQSDVNSTSFGVDKQTLLNDKITSLPPLTFPLYQVNDFDAPVNYQSYLQLPPLHSNYVSSRHLPYNLSGEYSNVFSNSDLASPNRIPGNEDNISHYTQVFLQSYYHPREKQLGSTNYLSSVQPIKVSNSFLSRPFKCDQCFQCFNRNHDLKRHKRIHLAVKPFPCPNCEKSFSRKDALKRHILVKGCIR